MNGNRIWRAICAVIVAVIYFVGLLIFLGPEGDTPNAGVGIEHLPDGTWQLSPKAMGYDKMRQVLGKPFKFMSVINGRGTLYDEPEGTGLQALSIDSFVNVDVQTGLQLGDVQTYTFSEISRAEIGRAVILTLVAILFGAFVSLCYRPRRAVTSLATFLNWSIRILLIGGGAASADAALLAGTPPVRVAVLIGAVSCLAAATVALLGRAAIPAARKAEAPRESVPVDMPPRAGVTSVKNAVVYITLVAALTVITLFANHRMPNAPASANVRCFGWPNTWLIRDDFIYHARVNGKLVKEERRGQWHILSPVSLAISVAVSVAAATIVMIPVVASQRRRGKFSAGAKA